MKTYIVSYPRSGSAWPRFLLSNILYPDVHIGWDLIDKYIPDIHQKTKWRKHNVVDPQIIKNHHKFRPDYLDGKVIYFYRDGRDVAVSYWRKLRYAPENDIVLKQPVTKFLDAFILGTVEDGLFGSWRDHITFWLFEKQGIDILPIKYEDMVKNPMAEARKIVEFLEWEVRLSVLEKAVAKSTYKETQKLNAPLCVGDSGTWGAWEKVFSEEDSLLFWSWAGSFMEKLGYKK